MTLRDKIAVVTGGNTGIGRGICARLAGEGATVVVDYVGRPDDAQSLATEITVRRREGVAAIPG